MHAEGRGGYFTFSCWSARHCMRPSGSILSLLDSTLRTCRLVQLNEAAVQLREQSHVTVSCCSRPTSSGKRVRQLLSSTSTERADMVKSWGGNRSMLLNWRNNPCQHISRLQLAHSAAPRKPFNTGIGTTARAPTSRHVISFMSSGRLLSLLLSNSSLFSSTCCRTCDGT